MKLLVLISGKLNSGKNTFAGLLQDALGRKGVTVKSKFLAEPLKQGCYEDFESLSKFLRAEWHKIDKISPVAASHLLWMLVEKEHFFEDKTSLTRHLLQIYGLEIFRNRVDPDYWIKKFMEQHSTEPSDVVLVTDFRFPGEWYFSVSSKNVPQVIAVRVARDVPPEEGQDHPSETALDEFPFVYVEDNNGTLEDLAKNADSFADVIKNYL